MGFIYFTFFGKGFDVGYLEVVHLQKNGADVPGAIAYCGENMSFSSILILKKGDQINMRRYNLRGDNLHW